MVQVHFPLKHNIIPWQYFRGKNKSNYSDNVKILIKNILKIILKINEVSYIQKVEGKNETFLELT